MPPRVKIGLFLLALVAIVALPSSAAAGTRWELDAAFGVNGTVASPGAVTISAVEPAASGGTWLVGSRIVGLQTFPTIGKTIASGAIDTSFGTNGFVTLSGVVGESRDVVQLAGGDLIAPIHGAATGGGLRTWRVSSAGVVRSTWGTAGVVNVGTADHSASLIELASDGNIIVAGDRRPAGPIAYPVTAKIDVTSGALDATYGTGGVREAAQWVSTTSWAGPTDLHVSASGRVLLGYQYFSFFLERYLPNGMLDAGFAGDGTLTDPSGLDARATPFSVDAAGAVSYAYELDLADGATMKSLVARRVTATGTFDASFGSGGKVVHSVPMAADEELDLANHTRLEDGSTIVTGVVASPRVSRGVALRLDPSGALVLGAGVDGIASFPTYGTNPLRDAVYADSGFIGVLNGKVIRTREVGIAPPRLYNSPVCHAYVGSSTLGSTVTGQLACRDVDGDAIHSFRLVTAPRNGSATVSATGAFSYTPTPGWGGTDVFHWAASDSMFLSTGMVAIDVTPDPARVPRDMKRPIITLKVAKKFFRARVGRVGIPATITCNEQCTTRAELVVTAKVAKGLGLKLKKPYRIGVGTVKISPTKAGKSTIKLTKAAKTALARASTSVPLKATIVLTATDAAGNATVRRLAIKL